MGCLSPRWRQASEPQRGTERSRNGRRPGRAPGRSEPLWRRPITKTLAGWRGPESHASRRPACASNCRRGLVRHIRGVMAMLALFGVQSLMPVGGRVHGGDAERVARQHGIAAGSLLDFSANLNPLGLPLRAAERLARDARDPSLLMRYPDP